VAEPVTPRSLDEPDPLQAERHFGRVADDGVDDDVGFSEERRQVVGHIGERPARRRQPVQARGAPEAAGGGGEGLSAFLRDLVGEHEHAVGSVQFQHVLHGARGGGAHGAEAIDHGRLLAVGRRS
jgi:hypothetical protein